MCVPLGHDNVDDDDDDDDDNDTDDKPGLLAQGDGTTTPTTYMCMPLAEAKVKANIISASGAVANIITQPPTACVCLIIINIIIIINNNIINNNIINIIIINYTSSSTSLSST